MLQLKIVPPRLKITRSTVATPAGKGFTSRKDGGEGSYLLPFELGISGAASLERASGQVVVPRRPAPQFIGPKFLFRYRSRVGAAICLLRPRQQRSSRSDAVNSSTRLLHFYFSRILTLFVLNLS